MTRATTEPTTSAVPATGTARRSRAAVVGVAVLGLVVAACGGGDDDSSDATTTTAAEVVATAAPTTVPAPTTTAAPVTSVAPEVDYVTEGATVVVANGAAGRLSERLAVVGYDMAEATNSADTVSNLATTQIYYDPAVEAALAVAESLQQALGGGDIEVLEVSVPALTSSGELGEASVLVLMGDDVADKTLDELQGRAPATPEDDESDTDTSDGDTETVEHGGGEEAGEQDAQHAADAVDGEDIERIIELEDALNKVGHDVTYDTGGEADDQRADRADIARRRGDGGQSGNGAGGDADQGRFALVKPLDEHPGQRGGGGGDVGRQ